jgi:WD40 repeat protein
VYSLAFSPDGKTLATADANGYVYLWNTASGRRTATLTGAQANALAVAFSPDGHTLATEGPGHIYLWNAATHALTATLTHYGYTTGMAFSPDGLTLAVAVDTGNAYLWNAATHALTATLTDPNISSDVTSRADLGFRQFLGQCRTATAVVSLVCAMKQ